MDGNKVLALEFFVSVGVVTVNEIKYGFWPYPPDIMRIAVSYAILGAVGVFNPNMAALLAGGFLVALLLNHFSSGKWTWHDPTQRLGSKANGGLQYGKGAQWWSSGSGFIYDGVPLSWSRATAPGTKTASGTSGAIGPTPGKTVTV